MLLKSINEYTACRIRNTVGGGTLHILPLIVALVVLLLGNTHALAGDSGSANAIHSSLAVSSLLLDGSNVDGHVVIVGERGHILLSDDEGDSWQQADIVPTRTTLTAVYFHDRNLGWAVGHDAVILRTTDGGITWKLVHSAPELQQPLLDVWFGDDQNGFAVGAYGYFLTTEDGGDSWNERRVKEEQDWHLNHISQSSTGRLFIAGEAGNLYRSDDRGKTWRNLPTPYVGSFYGTLPLDGDELLAYGLRGHVFRSKDAGESWLKVKSDTQALLINADRFPDKRVVIVGAGGTVLVGNSHAEDLRQLSQDSRRAITSVLTVGSNNLLLAGDGGIEKVTVR
jgi:photosystem II stability/assembly factor-like uncharacterized protein